MSHSRRAGGRRRDPAPRACHSADRPPTTNTVAPANGIDRARRRAARRRRGAATALVVLLAGACGHATPATPRRPNVIILLADTLRADRLGSVSRSPSLTPFLDSLAAEGTTFSRAYAPSSWTNPSIASLFTSRYPGQHGHIRLGSRLPERDAVLAERLADLGYATTAFFAQLLLSPGLGLTRGFATAQFVPSPANPLRSGAAADVNAAALRWLDRRSAPERARPTFLYLHYMDPHLPYHAPAEFLEPILLRQPDPGVARALAQRAAQRLDELLALIVAPGPDPAKELMAQRRLADVAIGVSDLYDAEVAYLDAQLRTLFEGLRARGLLDDCLVVFTADHGQEMFEHGQFGHGRTLYDEVLRVPLLLWQGGQQPVTVDTPVSLLDIAPTVLDVVGGPPPTGFMGRSLLGAIEASRGLLGWLRQLATTGGGPTRERVFAELYSYAPQPRAAGDGDDPMRAVATKQWKLIVEPPGPRETLFHLAVDSGERSPVDDPAAREPLRQALRELVADTRRAPPPATPLRLDEATRQRLRALGYAQ